MTDFLDEMDQLAAEIAKAARLAATELAEKIDAFKALTPYYVQKTKKPKSEDNDPELPTFDNFAERIHAIRTENQNIIEPLEHELDIINKRMEGRNGEGESGVRSGRRDRD